MAVSFSTLLEGLTDAQRAAVSHVDGPLLVLAGPGSGKTTVVTRRVANLIAQGIPAWQILALTFTNKAANEMRERIERVLPADLPGRRGLTVATFHSFCARLLRRYAEPARLKENYTIYDTGDQREAIKQAMKTAGLDSKNWTPATMAAAISNAKNQLIEAAAYAEHAGDFFSRQAARIYTEYERILKANNAVDFDDLLLITARLLREREAIRQELQDRFRYVLIDEYQDTNHAQFVIAHALAAAHRNICVVGDPDQSIYAWRGADISNILDFETHYPQAKVVPLGQNFRSTGHIVAAADALIRRNRSRRHKDLYTELEEGEKPTVVMCRDEHHEAELIVDDLVRRREGPATSGDGGAGGVAWKDMAVLYRINALSRVLEEAFRNAQVPYVIARGTAFYERKEIKDALAYLRLVANPSDEVPLRRIVNTPPRGIGATSLDRIDIHAIQKQMTLFDAMRRVDEISGVPARTTNAVRKFVSMVERWRAMDNVEELIGDGRSPLAELVERIIRESGMEAMYRESKLEEERERFENLEELITAAGEFEPPEFPEGEVGGLREAASGLLATLSAFLEGIALVSDADAIDPASGAVTLMTLHAAKGLEFEVVAMAGLEEGLLPHSRAAESEKELEEERRLCFVGMTRAKRHLLMTSAATRMHRGYRQRSVPSSFLRELPEDGVTTLDMAGEIDGFDDEFRPQWGGKSKRRVQRDEFGDVVSDDPGSWRPRSAGVGDSPFPVGCMVRHPTFGVGRVEGITRRPAGSSARVAFRDVGVKTLILEYAKLERLE
jgi:DNA helicase II / ATP-dependent DNA helicase PcrA